MIQGDKLYEMWRADFAGGSDCGAFSGGCLAVWDLERDYSTHKSAQTNPAGHPVHQSDAAGFPVTDLQLHGR